MPITSPAELHDQLTQAFNQRAWPRVRELAAHLLPLAPRHPLVNYMAGIACMELQQSALALEYLQRAASTAPGRADFAVHFAKALSLSHRNEDAKSAADHARELSLADPAMLDTLGVIYTRLNDHESAVAMFRRAAELAPQRAPFRYNLATSLIATGRIDAAEIELERCLALQPRHWLAHFKLAQLRPQSSAHNHVPRLESLLQQASLEGSDNEALMCLNMALAKEHEDLADHARSFRHLARGKAAGAARLHYSILHDEALFAALIAAFPPSTDSTNGCDSDEPIFIIGMPRSGTTLVERIISSHPDVQSLGELLNFGMAFKRLSGCNSPVLLDAQTVVAAGQPDWRTLGEAYLASTRPDSGRKPRFIDKLPYNFLYAGYIAKALPQARIICLRRHPLDVCLSNFRQLFAPNSPFSNYSFDLLDIGRYYILFDRLMAHWQRVLRGRILELDYEALVNSQEASSRKLLEFCGLPWDDACMGFHSNPSAVATASAAQVRKPMYRGALHRWKKYEPQLDELRALLTEAGIRLDP
ncbi:MAG TPA: sulfotransferase [Rhodanobacter sp.]|nr:sulfotransferase [Rhodanobacter sp.]